MLDNTWINYIQRSYYQIKSSILAKLGIRLPAMTDHSESNPLIAMSSLFSGLTEHLNYYIDSRARESFITSAKKLESGIAHATQRGYRVRGINPSSVNLRFILNAPATEVITIPVGTEVAGDAGVIFATVETGVMNIGDVDIVVPGINRIAVATETIGTATGLINSKFRVGEDVVDKDLQVFVDGNVYTFVEYLGDYLNEDVFTTTIEGDGAMYVVFGDGINGSIPTQGAVITVSYYLSSGSAGNVAAFSLNTLLTPLTLPVGFVMTVTNTQQATGGTDQDTLEDIKRNATTLSLTANRAVTREDFPKLAASVAGVAKARAFYNYGDRYVSLYIVPVGGGVASALLLKTVELYFEKKRMVQTPVTAFSAGVVEILLQIAVTARPTARNSVVTSNVLANLLALGDIDNNEISGAVYISDVYEAVETAEGVRKSEIVRMSYIPYALGVGINIALLWTPVIKNPTTAAEWKITVTTGTNYSLYKNSVFVGNFAMGVQQELDEMFLMVLDSSTYSTGDSWVFRTYPVGGSIEFQDLVIPHISAENVVLNVSGGI